MLILASASPRRRRLLEEAGIAFTVRVADVDEIAPERGDPHAVARENAARKARAVEGEAVLGADTVVAVGDRLLGKPVDRDELLSVLGRYRGSDGDVLVIEDDADTRGMLSRLVTRAGLRATEAANGEEGLAALERSKPAVIVLEQQYAVFLGQIVFELFPAQIDEVSLYQREHPIAPGRGEFIRNKHVAVHSMEISRCGIRPSRTGRVSGR